MGTDTFTPLSTALWNFGEAVSFNSPELEEVVDELLSEIVDRMEGLEKGVIE